VRVRAGATPKLVNLAGENLYDQGGNATSVKDEKGNVYILSNGTGQTPFLRKYDAAGNYLKTLFPPPPNLPADSVKSYRINVLPDGGWVPKTRPIFGNGVQFGYLVLKKGATLSRYAAGKIMVTTGNSGTHYIDTNGCFTDTLSNPLQKAAFDAGAAGTTMPRLLKAQAAFHEGPFVMERVAVDRTNDRVYWNGSNYISTWRNPAISKLPVDLDDITVGPNGFIYGWNLEGQSTYGNAFVRRYNSTTYAAVNYGASSGNAATGEVHYEFGNAGTPGNHRGIAVGWQGQLAAFAEFSPLFQTADTNGSATVNDPGQVLSGGKALVTATNFSGYGKDGAAQTRQGFMGVRYDPAGYYYVGIRKLSGPIVPAGFGLDPAFRNIGSVVKFHKDSVGTFHSVQFGLTGYTKIYKQPYGPFTAVSDAADVLGEASCTCRSSRFDVDPYGRLYIPNGVTCQIYVADNAGNNISVFGQYGNTDSRGGLTGPGQVNPKPDFPMAWPSSVGASEDYIYVTDLVNARIMRVQMVYAIDNIPGLTDRFSATEKAAALVNIKLLAWPNPFHPVSNITLSLPAASHVDLKVYDMNGRLVRSLAAGQFGPGTHHFSWDAKDGAGRNVSPGVYVYKLTAGKRVLTERAILAK